MMITAVWGFPSPELLTLLYPYHKAILEAFKILDQIYHNTCLHFSVPIIVINYIYHFYGKIPNKRNSRKERFNFVSEFEGSVHQSRDVIERRV